MLFQKLLWQRRRIGNQKKSDETGPIRQIGLLPERFGVDSVRFSGETPLKVYTGRSVA